MVSIYEIYVRTFLIGLPLNIKQRFPEFGNIGGTVPAFLFLGNHSKYNKLGNSPSFSFFGENPIISFNGESTLFNILSNSAVLQLLQLLVAINNEVNYAVHIFLFQGMLHEALESMVIETINIGVVVHLSSENRNDNRRVIGLDRKVRNGIIWLCLTVFQIKST